MNFGLWIQLSGRKSRPITITPDYICFLTTINVETESVWIGLFVITRGKLFDRKQKFLCLDYLWFKLFIYTVSHFPFVCAHQIQDLFGIYNSHSVQQDRILPGLLEAVNNSWNFIQLWNTWKDDDDVSNSEWPRLRADCKFFCQPRSCDFVVAGILNCFGLLQTKILLALNFFSLR